MDAFPAGRRSSKSSSSKHSFLYLANSSHKVTKLTIGSKNSKLQEKTKNRSTGSGCIEKRLNTRRRIAKKPVKRRTAGDKATKKRRRQTLLSAFSQFSSRSSSLTSRCSYCGHRCCRRSKRYIRKDAFRKRREQKRVKPKLKVNQMKRGHQKKLKKKSNNILMSACLQAGSTSLMLSPLCTNRADIPTLDTTEAETPLASEITPEMIYEAMRRLTLWRHDVTTMAILEYIKRCYPVSHDIPALCEELSIKLDVAAKVGIVKATSAGRWQLMNALEKRHLTTNHVSLFWTIYADTMKPVTRKPRLATEPDEDKMDTQTERKAEGDIADEIRTSGNMNIHYEIT